MEKNTTENRRFCRQCGKLLKAEEMFCTSCGTPVMKSWETQVPLQMEEPDYNGREESDGRKECSATYVIKDDFVFFEHRITGRQTLKLLILAMLVCFFLPDVCGVLFRNESITHKCH